MGLFDISMLRYLPWFRTGCTAVIDSSCYSVKDAVDDFLFVYIF